MSYLTLMYLRTGTIKKKTTEFQDFSIISYVYVHTKNHIAQQHFPIKLNIAQAQMIYTVQVHGK